MLRHLTFIALLILLLSTEVPGTCVAKPSIEKAVEGSALVFVGKVTKIIPAQLATASYSVQRRKRLWEKYFFKTDIVTFEVSEVLKGVPGETIEIATSADGEAGYKFEGGTWLKVGQSYLVYASKRKLEGTVDSDW